MKQFLNRLGSPKLTLTLFLLLAVMSAFGTFLPQGPDTGRWEEILGSAGARIAAAAGLVDFFHSPWFGLLLVGLCVNMVACMWGRIPGMVSSYRGKAALGRASVLDLPDGDRSEHRLIAVLRSHGFRESGHDPDRLFHRWAVSYLFILFTHVSLLIVMIASVAGSALGFVMTQRIYVGDTAGTAFSWKVMDEVPLPFEVRVDDLVVVPNVVGVRLGVLKIDTGEKGKLITTHEGASFTVPGLAGRVTLDRFHTEEKGFTARWSGAGGTTFGAGEQIGQSGLALVPVAYATWPERQVLAPAALLVDGLEVASGEISINHPMTRDGVRIYLTDYGKDRFGLPYVGFQFVRDPGEMGVWIGSVLFLLGATGAVFTRHSCAVVIREGGRLRVHLSSRGDRDKIIGQLLKALDEGNRPGTLSDS
ncbi:MAG: cytochrome c biogenesis protein ResB [bacterium]|nr:cytochrome c biogenesis protein ResB [bacterium]MDT8395002.1 cytochrome c biogenesis protein ResB [bacterium]